MCLALTFNVKQLYEQILIFLCKRNPVSFVSLWLKGRSKMFSNSKAILALIFKVDKAKRENLIFKSRRTI